MADSGGQDGFSRRGLLAGTAATAALAALATPAIAARPNRPNVLFIVVDDLNDWIEPLGGYPLVLTPHLKRLAALSRTFVNAHTSAPACGPARAATIFGIEPHKSGMYTIKEQWWRNTVLLQHRSLMAAFRDRGYRTFGTGKILHGTYTTPAKAYQVDAAAWSEFEFCDGASRRCRLIDAIGDDDDVERVAGINFGPAGNIEDTPDYVRANWMVKRVLSKARREPFFAAIGLSKPHLPFVVPQQFFDLYDGTSLPYPPGVLDPKHPKYRKNADTADLPRTARAFIDRTYKRNLAIYQSGEWRNIIRAYLASISFMDHCVGILLDGLLKGPHAGNTIVVLWSDHGWQLGEKLAWQKFTLWERATKIPLMIGGPGIAAGRSKTPASSIDLYPTLMDLAFNEVPEHLDGRSLRKHLLNGKSPGHHVMSTWMLDHANPLMEGPHFSIRTKKRRLIRYRNGETEVYDHTVDPYEWTNIAGTVDPAVLAAMLAEVPPLEACAARNG